jgi:hypothetical protein
MTNNTTFPNNQAGGRPAQAELHLNTPTLGCGRLQGLRNAMNTCHATLH